MVVAWFATYGERKATRMRSGGIGRVTGAAPDLPVPGNGPECGGKFCELRGCAILGKCGAPE